MTEWQPIETAPMDGTWFVIWTRYGWLEVGRYAPTNWPKYVPIGNGLFREEQEQISKWEGFSNFSAATHWCPLPTLPNKDR